MFTYDKTVKPFWELWLSDKTPALQATAKKYPPGTSFNVHGETMYAVGYNDAGGLLISKIDPALDYKGSIAVQQRVCDCCMNKLEDVLIKRGVME